LCSGLCEVFAEQEGYPKPHNTSWMDETAAYFEDAWTQTVDLSGSGEMSS
jgi:hypothetical protein